MKIVGMMTGYIFKSIIDKDFKLFEPVMQMIEKNLNVKIVLFYRNNFYSPEKVQSIIHEKLYWNRNKVECDVANSYGDLWFLLRKNVENFDKIHLFSSEKQWIPEAVKRFFKEKNSYNTCRCHYTGSSIEGYISKVNLVINTQLKEIKDDKRFIIQVYQEESIQIKEENKIPIKNGEVLEEHKSTKENSNKYKYI